VIDYKGHAISAESITIGKLGAESEGQTSENIRKRTIQLWNQLPAHALGTFILSTK
jgi:hypothetical protein